MASDTIGQSPPPQAAPPAEPTSEQIRTRAYLLYCERNGGPGDEISDWLQAERELRAAACPLAPIAIAPAAIVPKAASRRPRSTSPGAELLRAPATIGLDFEMA